MSKAGPDTLRWAAVEASQQAWRPTNPWHELYADIKRRHGKANPAKAAVARKILIASWHMLSRNEPFKPSAPRATDPAPASSSIRLAALRPTNDLRSRGSCNRLRAADERRKRCQQPAAHDPAEVTTTSPRPLDNTTSFKETNGWSAAATSRPSRSPCASRDRRSPIPRRKWRRWPSPKRRELPTSSPTISTARDLHHAPGLD